MTVAAIDRLVHHATIFELNVESYRRRAATRARAATTTSDNHALEEAADATVERRPTPEPAALA
jgi:IstB-like ATP binding protein